MSGLRVVTAFAVIFAAGMATVYILGGDPERRLWFNAAWIIAVGAGAGMLFQLLARLRRHCREAAAARNREDLLNTTLESIGEGVLATDAAGRVTRINGTALRLVGLAEARQALGRRIEEIFRIVSSETGKPVESPVAQVLRDGAVVGLANHTKLLALDGREHHIADSAAPILDASGQICGVILIFHDVSSEYVREEKLRESEARLQSIFRAAPVGIGLVRNRVLAAVNDRVCELTGYPVSDLIGKSARMLYFSDEEFEQAGREKYRMMGERGIGTVETRWRARDGRELYVLISSTPLDMEHPEAGITFTVLDISAMKAAERRLRLTQFAIDRALDAVFWVRPDGGFAYVNDAACSRLGYSRDEMLAKTVHDIDPHFPASDWPRRWEHLRKFGNLVIESEHRARNGDLIPVELNANHLVFEGRQYGCVFAHDISNRVAAANKLKRLALIIDSTSDLVAIASHDGQIQYINRGGCRLLGLADNASLVRRQILDYHNEASGRIITREAFPAAEKNGSWQGETVLIAEDGTEIPVSQVIMVHRNESTGAAEYCSTVIRDLRPQKAAAAALQAEKDMLGLIMRSIGDGVISTDHDGLVNYLNRAAEQMTGWGKAEACGRPLAEVFLLGNGDDGDQGAGLAAAILGGSGPLPLPRQSRLLARSGDGRDIAGCGMPIRNRAGQGVGAMVVFHDVTDERQRDELLLRQQKLEAIGVLAGGIAHDFNNLLTGIMANASIGKLRAADNDEVNSIFEGIEHASLRARDLTGQLLTFARGGLPVKRPLDTRRAIERAAAFAMHGSNIRLRTEMPGDLWPLFADHGQFNQVVSNLVINAQQAMPGGGELTIAAENVTVDSLSPLPLRPGRYLQIRVDDTGIGIPQEHLARIFDPYFSTKQKGSGLGLATTYSIIERHNGLITVKSTPGQGASFTIYLPAAREEDAADAATAADQPAVRPNARILVMDDEPVILQALGRLLRSLGYVAEFTTNGTDAVARYRQAAVEGRPFDAVIMDLTIPGGVGGREAACELRKFDPAVKAIVSSGYSNDPIMAQYREHGFCAVLEKPYMLKQLRSVLGAVLGATQA